MNRQKLRRLAILRGALYATLFWVALVMLYGLADRVAGLIYRFTADCLFRIVRPVGARETAKTN